MKKFTLICLTLAMCLSLSFNVFADNGAFISSPSKNEAPVLVEVESEQEVIVTVTPFSERHTLDTEAKSDFDKAHETIVNASSVVTLHPQLETIAKDKGIKSDNLGISDLFDVSANVYLTHDVAIKLKVETAEHFVALLHYHDNEWEVVENATVVDSVLHFTVDSLSPFAIVVDRQAATETAPLTSDNGVSTAIAVTLLVAALGITIASKKVKA